jgi:hypothetical protein
MYAQIRDDATSHHSDISTSRDRILELGRQLQTEKATKEALELKVKECEDTVSTLEVCMY